MRLLRFVSTVCIVRPTVCCHASGAGLVRDPRAVNWSPVKDATRVGVQFPFRPEPRGRGAPSVAMKWRDAVKSAIMHGPLPPDVTLDAPCWWQPGMPL